MLEEGLVTETNHLVEKYGIKARPLGSLGYKQAAEFLGGELTREQTLQMIQQGHRNYAKRQMTWYRREPGETWLQGFGEDPEILRSICSIIAGS